MRKGEQPPWIVPDELWARIEPLLPRVERRYRHPGRRRLDDRKVLSGILFVLYTGIPWEFLPRELGFGSGMTCWRRLRDWHRAGVWQRLHETLLAELHAAGALDWSRAVIDSSHVQALKGTPLAYSGSGCGGEFESLEVAGPGPVEGPAGPPGVQPDQVDCGRGGVVLQAGLVQAEVAGAADAGDVGGLAHGALYSGADVAAGFPLAGGLPGAGGGDGLMNLPGAQRQLAAVPG